MINATDAAGHTIHLGDTVGSLTRFAADWVIVIGIVRSIDDATGTIGIEITNTPRHQVAKGDRIDLVASTSFFVGRALDAGLANLTDFITEVGPALVYITPQDDEGRVHVRRIDEQFGLDLHHAAICRALIITAIDRLTYDRPVDFATTDYPALVYAGSDRTSVTRVDQVTVTDPRENRIALALLRHTWTLADAVLNTPARVAVPAPTDPAADAVAPGIPAGEQ